MTVLDILDTYILPETYISIYFKDKFYYRGKNKNCLPLQFVWYSNFTLSIEYLSIRIDILENQRD